MLGAAIAAVVGWTGETLNESSPTETGKPGVQIEKISTLPNGHPGITLEAHEASAMNVSDAKLLYTHLSPSITNAGI